MPPACLTPTFKGRALEPYEKTSDCRRLYLQHSLVRAKGFEPPTFGTGNQRSIQLSYARSSELTATSHFGYSPKVSTYAYVPPLKTPFSRYAPWIGVLEAAVLQQRG